MGMIMFDDFFIRALFAGIGLAVIVGPLGCLIIWRKMAFFGDTLAHAALLGIALAILADVSSLIAVPFVTLAICIAIMVAKRTPSLSSDTILAILAHSTLALGLVLVSVTGGRNVDVNGLLFGDILSVDTTDLLVIYAGGGAILAIIVWQWRRLVAATLSPEIAEAEGLSPQRTEWLFMVLIALVVSIAVKLVGVLLITALMIIPAAAARRLVTSPEMMAVLASILGVIGVIAGLYGSAEFDTPSGPSIIVAGALLLLGLTFVPRRLSVANDSPAPYNQSSGKAFMASDKTDLINLENAGVRRDNRWLVRGIDLRIRKGEIVTIIGPNGAGKSTTAKLAVGTIRANEGRVQRQAGLRVGYVPQKLHIDPALPMRVDRLLDLTAKVSPDEKKQALEAVGASHLATAFVQDLSGGEFQRILLARAMVRRPNLLVLDEPVQGVDFASEAMLYNLIRQIRDTTGCGVLMISHDLHIVMADTDTVLCLNGHICCSGSPDSVVSNPEYLRLFGAPDTAALAVYRHDHDHIHLPDGTVQHADGSISDSCHPDKHET